MTRDYLKSVQQELKRQAIPAFTPADGHKQAESITIRFNARTGALTATIKTTEYISVGDPLAL